MNRERFEALAAAYGGNISRWPVAERRAARWLAFCSRGLTQDILHDARRFDRILKQSVFPELGPRSRESLIEGARCLRDMGGERRPWLGAILGAGLAAACVAGIGVGFVLAPLTTTDSLTTPVDPGEVAASALGNPTELGDG